MAGCGAGGRLEGLDMEVPSGGAAGRCASVWEGFLHRNRVLPLTLSTTPLCLQTRWFLNGSEEKKSILKFSPHFYSSRVPSCMLS